MGQNGKGSERMEKKRMAKNGKKWEEMVKQKLETSGKRVKHMIFKGTWRVCDEDLMNKHVGYDGTIFLS